MAGWFPPCTHWRPKAAVPDRQRCARNGRGSVPGANL